MSIERYLHGNKCLCCGVKFKWEEKHPPSIEYINGYPAPCRHIGRSVFSAGLTDVWIESWIEDYPPKKYIDFHRND